MVWICMVHLLTQNIHTWNKCHAYPYIYGNLWYYKSTVFTTNNDPPKLPRNFPKKIDWPLRNGGPWDIGSTSRKKLMFFSSWQLLSFVAHLRHLAKWEEKTTSWSPEFFVKNPFDSVDGSEIQRENPPVIFHEILSKMVYSPYQLVCRISSINGIA